MTLVDPRPTAAARSVLVLRGDVDASAAPRLRAELRGRIDAGVQEIVVDAAEISFIDSAGLGVLVGAARRLCDERGGCVCLRGAEPGLLRVLRLTRLEHVFELDADPERT